MPKCELKLRPLSNSKWSGGGENLYNNVELAEKNFPDGFSQTGIPVVFKNTVHPSQLLTGNYIYIPQNAWAWHGPANTAREIFRRTTLRVLSDIAMHRARKVVRIGPMIPRSANCAEGFLPNTLDETFEDALSKAHQLTNIAWTPRDSYFIAPGSYWSYRNLEFLIRTYSKYTENSENPVKLVIVGPATQSKYFNKIKQLASANKRIDVIGKKVRREELLSAIAHSTACIFSSLVEASPVTLLEAAAVEAKIIASDTPAHKYIESQLGGASLNYFSDANALLQYFQTPLTSDSSLLTNQHYRKEQRKNWGKLLLAKCLEETP